MHVSPSDSPAEAAAMEQSSGELGAIIARFAACDGDHTTLLPQVSLHRYSEPKELQCTVSQPSLIIAAQGAKRVTVSDEGYEYDARHCLITAIDLPMTSQVTRASTEQPYLCVGLALNAQRIAGLMAEMGQPRARSIPLGRPIGVEPLSWPLLDAAVRLLRLLDTPADIPILAPLIERELLFRLLRGTLGPRLRQLAAAEAEGGRIPRAIDWLKQHYHEPLRIEELSQRLNMSVSSLHHQFKSATSMSPLQYQKQLRLHEARRLLLQRGGDIGLVALQVGYESPSQVNREYSRLFGTPPLRDLTRLRQLA